MTSFLPLPVPKWHFNLNMSLYNWMWLNKKLTNSYTIGGLHAPKVDSERSYGRHAEPCTHIKL